MKATKNDRTGTEATLKAILDRNLAERIRLNRITTSKRFEAKSPDGRSVLADLGAVEARLLLTLDLIGQSPRDVSRENAFTGLAGQIVQLDDRIGGIDDAVAMVAARMPE